MTVANTLIAGELAYLVTDGAETDLATGILRSIKSKVVRIASVRAAFTAIGGAWVCPFLQQDIEQQNYGSYEDLVSGVRTRLPTTIREVFEQVPGAPRHWGEFAVVFVGWSAGPQADILHVRDTSVAHIVRRLPARSWLSLPVSERLDAADINTSAVRVLQAQRLMPEGPVKLIPAAGFVEVTRVSQAGITSEIIRPWHDVVGSRPVIPG